MHSLGQSLGQKLLRALWILHLHFTPAFQTRFIFNLSNQIYARIRCVSEVNGQTLISCSTHLYVHKSKNFFFLKNVNIHFCDRAF